MQGKYNVNNHLKNYMLKNILTLRFEILSCISNALSIAFLWQHHQAGITSFWCDHFGATYFVAGRFRHRSFRLQFGALWQFSYLGLGLGSGVGFGLGLVKKNQLLATKRSAPKWLGRKVVDPIKPHFGGSAYMFVWLCHHFRYTVDCLAPVGNKR